MEGRNGQPRLDYLVFSGNVWSTEYCVPIRSTDRHVRSNYEYAYSISVTPDMIHTYISTGKIVTRSRSGTQNSKKKSLLLASLFSLQQCFFPQAIIRVSEQIFSFNICSNSFSVGEVVSMRAHDRLKLII